MARVRRRRWPGLIIGVAVIGALLWAAYWYLAQTATERAIARLNAGPIGSRQVACSDPLIGKSFLQHRCTLPPRDLCRKRRPHRRRSRRRVGASAALLAGLRQRAPRCAAPRQRTGVRDCADRELVRGKHHRVRRSWRHQGRQRGVPLADNRKRRRHRAFAGNGRERRSRHGVTGAGRRRFLHADDEHQCGDPRQDGWHRSIPR